MVNHLVIFVRLNDADYSISERATSHRQSHSSEYYLIALLHVYALFSFGWIGLNFLALLAVFL